MTTAIFLSCIVVFITHTLEAVTGFGCTVLALPFVTALLGIRTGVISLTVIAWILAAYFAITKRKQIDFKQYGIILICMLAGLPVGMYLFRKFDIASLKKVLAVFICIVSLWQLIGLLLIHPGKTVQSGKNTGQKLYEKTAYYLLLIIGGIVHGMFSSGGPLAVLYASKMIPDKSRFRATMCLLWTTLNTIIIIGYIVDKSFTRENCTITAIFIPFLIAGIFLGDIIHTKVNARMFSIMLFTVLLLTGIVMVIA